MQELFDTTKVERTRNGCKYCTESKHNGYSCKHLSCPYADEFVGFKTYKEYADNAKIFTGFGRYL